MGDERKCLKEEKMAKEKQLNRRRSFTFGSRRSNKNVSTLDHLDLDTSSTSIKFLIEKLRDEELNCPGDIPRTGSLSDMFSNTEDTKTAIENFKKCEGDIIDSIYSKKEINSEVEDIEHKDWKMKNVFRSKKERELEVELILSL